MHVRVTAGQAGRQAGRSLTGEVQRADGRREAGGGERRVEPPRESVVRHDEVLQTRQLLQRAGDGTCTNNNNNTELYSTLSV